jgi:hypothetical protein
MCTDVDSFLKAVGADMSFATCVARDGEHAVVCFGMSVVCLNVQTKSQLELIRYSRLPP